MATKEGYAALPQELTDEEKFMVTRGKRWVVVLCFIQLVMCVFSVFIGYFFVLCVAALFISFGLVGAIRQNPRLLIAHHIFSLVLYILTLVGVALMILYCDMCSWINYLISFFFVIFQAVGLKYSRNLIRLTYKANGWTCARGKCCKTQTACNNEQPCATQSTQTPNEIPLEVVTPVAPVTPSAPETTPTAPATPAPFYGYPVPMYVTYPQQYPQQYPQFYAPQAGQFPFAPYMQQQAAPQPRQM
jgi:hypothetical protein